MSGHNKWSKIKNVKAKNEAQTSKLYTKIGREIAVAVKAGGADINSNAKLKTIVAKAKSANMPNDNINRAIKKASGELGSVNYESVTYEGYGPAGSAVMVTALTDNKNRTASDVRHAFDKFGGSLGANGCVSYLFDKKGVIVVLKGIGISEDDITMTALEADIVLVGPNGERVVNIKDFYTGPGKTVRDRCEVCKCFKIKKENYENYYGYYFKYGKRKSLEIATLGCSVLVKLNASKDTIEDVKIAYGVAAPTPSRAPSAEAFAKGKKLSENFIEEFGEKALSDMKPRDSWRASKEFREQLIKEMARRTLVNAIRRAGGKIEYYV